MVKVIWLAAILVVQNVAATQTLTFKVAGTVVREDKQDPAHASNGDRVSLRSSGGSSVVDVGDGGAFEFANVRPGTYQLLVGPMVTMDPITVVVTDKDVTGLRVVVPDIVSVRGSVVVEGGGPQPRFQMTFTRVDRPAPPVSVTATGIFTAPLPPGQYRVASSSLPNGYSINSAMHGTTDVLRQPLQVAAGDSEVMLVTLGVSSPAPWVNVSGRVTSGNPNAPPATSITLSGNGIANALTAALNPDGSFSLSRVLPGAYTAIAFAANGVSAPVAVTVGSTDTTNLVIRMPAPKDVGGHIVVQGNVPMPRVAFSLVPVGGPVPAGGVVSLPANAQQDGSFNIELPEGERQINVLPGSLPAGYRVASFTYGTTDLIKNPIRVALNDTAELRLTLDAGGVTPVTVRGRVTGLLATKGVRVVLMSPILSSVEASVNPDGSFAFSRIIPGNYNARLSLSGLSAGTPIAVRNTDVTDVTIAYPREFVVTGHVIVEDGSAGPSPQVTLDAKNAAGVSRSSNGLNDGVLMLNLKDGEYNVSLRSLPSGYQLKSIMFGSVDLQKAPLKIDGPVTWEIIVRLTR